ncbi:MAG: exodeoxyribonuclease III [Zetaproteobacteria bacterium]|nr:MAG: exodeoxyribonuclease III [Zetaproteobacteria bacterium]
MNIVSWNVNSLNVRLAHVLDLLREQAPDIVALQETKTPDERFPRDALRDAGYEVAFSGQKTYNGVAILSRQPILDIETRLPGMADDPQRRLLAATIGGLRVVNVYIPNGQAVGSDKYAYKMRWLAALEPYLADQLSRYPALVLLGDFNIAPADIDVHDPARWRGKIMCSDEERAWFQRLLALGLKDAPRTRHPDKPMFSWWDYRLNAYRRGWGLRIDHILTSGDLIVRDAGVDVGMRERERPSDHAPVWVELA